MPSYTDTALETAFIALLTSHNINKAKDTFAYADLAAWEAGTSLE